MSQTFAESINGDQTRCSMDFISVWLAPNWLWRHVGISRDHRWSSMQLQLSQHIVEYKPSRSSLVSYYIVILYTFYNVLFYFISVYYWAQAKEAPYILQGSCMCERKCLSEDSAVFPDFLNQVFVVWKSGECENTAGGRPAGFTPSEWGGRWHFKHVTDGKRKKTKR